MPQIEKIVFKASSIRRAALSNSLHFFFFSFEAAAEGRSV